MKSTKIMAAAVLIIGNGFGLQLAQAQQPGIGRTNVLQHDLSAPRRETVQTRVDFAPGAAFAKHTHPGDEIAYVLEGTMQYQFEGKPPITLKAGDALFVPAGTIHAAKNIGSGKASELATYVVEKGKPLVVLAK